METKEYQKRYREEHAEDLKEYHRRYRLENAEKIKERNKKWRQENKEKHQSLVKAWRQKNPEKAKEYTRICNARHKVEYSITRKKWVENNKDKVLEINRRADRKARPRKRQQCRGWFTKQRRYLETVKMHYKCTNPECKWMGQHEPCIYDFHHVNRSEKSSEVAKTKSMEKLIIEINKCCVLCAICHRLETSGKLDATNFVRCKVDKDGTIS